MIFERENIDEYHYTASNRKELSQYEEKTGKNRLFLATATAWNCELTRNAFMWFVEGIDTYSPQTLDNAFISELEQDNSKEMKEFMLDFVHHADLNISDYSFETREETTSPFMNPVRKWKLDIGHDIDTGYGVIQRFYMPFVCESEGTIKAFSYGPFIRKALNTGKTMVVDEIDSSLHPMLIRYLIELFNDSSINTKGAQLVFTTHDVSLLDQDLFRRDQIYFVEKNNGTGISELYSLDEFSVRKSENIRKGYMQGRYGAVPSIIPGVKK